MSHLTEQQEWDELLDTIPADTPTGDAATLILAGLDDAAHAHRQWAKQRLWEATHAGLTAAWKRHLKRRFPDLPTKSGTMRQVGGARRRSDDGRVVHLQLPFQSMTFAEIEANREMQATSRRKLGQNVKALDRLLALKELAPSAATPEEACELLGLEPAEVLRGVS